MRSKIFDKLSRSIRAPSLAGNGLPERMRTTAVAFLGLTAAAGLALVAIFAQLGFPLLSPAPLPSAPQEPNSLSKAVPLERGPAAVAVARAQSPEPVSGSARGGSDFSPGRGGERGSGVDDSAQPVSASPPGEPPESPGPVVTPPPAATPAPAPPAAVPTPATTTESTPTPVETPAAPPEAEAKPDRSTAVSSKPDKPEAKPAKSKPAKSKPAKPEAKPAKPETKPAKPETKPEAAPAPEATYSPAPAPVPDDNGKGKEEKDKHEKKDK